MFFAGEFEFLQNRKSRMPDIFRLIRRRQLRFEPLANLIDLVDV